MASLGTSSFSLPNHLVPGVWRKAQTTSALAKLSGAEPQLFGNQEYMTLTATPKAEVVGEGAQKSQSQPGFAPVTAIPRKVQVTQRFNEEVQWADEDYQLGVLQTMRDLAGEALGRALDLIAIHGINPLTGVALTGTPAKLLDTTNSVEVTSTSKPDTDLEAAMGLLLAQDVTPTGIAISPGYAWSLSTQRDTQNRKLYPDLGMGIVNGGTIEGLPAAASTTVNAPEATVTGGAYATTNPNVKAIVGDFGAFRWGIQRNIAVQPILYGDPDGQGDLKRSNQIALRAEVVYGIGILLSTAFAKVVDAVTP